MMFWFESHPDVFGIMRTSVCHFMAPMEDRVIHGAMVLKLTNNSHLSK